MKYIMYRLVISYPCVVVNIVISWWRVGCGIVVLAIHYDILPFLE